MTQGAVRDEESRTKGAPHPEDKARDKGLIVHKAIEVAQNKSAKETR